MDKVKSSQSDNSAVGSKLDLLEQQAKQFIGEEAGGRWREREGQGRGGEDAEEILFVDEVRRQMELRKLRFSPTLIGPEIT